MSASIAMPGLATRPFRYLSVCFGIEAASVAWEPLGWEPAGFAEIAAFPSRVLAARWPQVRNYGDFTSIPLGTADLGTVDLLVGGTPCQAFSVAGKRRSLQDARGNLSLAYAELMHGLARSHGLRWAVFELKGHHCRWIIAGTGADARYCGCRRSEDERRWYCGRHQAMAVGSGGRQRG